MTEDLDLRPYFEALIHYWYIIIITIMIGAALGFGVKVILPSSYEAAALVTVTIPREFVLSSLTEDDVDPQLIVQNNPAYFNAYPELATSNDVLQLLLTSLNEEGYAIEDVSILKRQINAELGEDPTLVRLIVQNEEPGDAMVIANRWAEIYVPWVNEVFGNQGNKRIQFFNEQLQLAQADLESSEQQLIDFQTQNRTTTISNTLSIYNQLQLNYLAEQNKLNSLTNDVNTLQEQLRNLNDSNNTFAYQLTALSLQLQAYNNSNIPGNILLNDATILTGADTRDQLDFLSTLADAIETRKEQIAIELINLEPQILTLQQQVEEAKIENDRLERARDESQELYTALVRKVVGEQITAQDTSGGVQLVSFAGLPANEVGMGGLIFAIVGAVLGAILGLIIVFVLELWPRNSRSS